jgi:cell division transport system permease protein
MDKFFYLLTDGMKNLWRHKLTTFTAVFTLFLALFFVGLLATAGTNTHKILQYLRTKYKIEVFFKQDVSNDEAIGYIYRIKQIKGVRTATIIEKEDAIRIFKDQFGENIIDILGYNPLPVSAVVNINRTSRDRLSVEPIINEIKAINQVDEVRYQGSLINKIERTYTRIIDQFPFLAGIIIFFTVLVIYNTMKLSVYGRRELITSLQLIGATRTFVKMPFIFEGIFIGILSVSLVFPALIGSINGINYLLMNFTSWGIKLIFDPTVLIWLFVLVISITFVGSYRAVSNFLK